jgi:hypothetical protein
MRVDSTKRALHLRKGIMKDGKVLVTDFSDTLQGKDTSKVIDLMPNVNTGEYVFRAKVNVKEIDPIAVGVYGKDHKDIFNMGEGEIEDLIKRSEFDFPLWYKHDEGFDMRNVHNYNLPFIMQVAGCNFNDGTETGGCWYCFVDNASNDGELTTGKTFLGARDTVDSIISAQKKIKETYRQHGVSDLEIKVMRTSGGEPTVALDWVLELWREIEDRGLDLVGQLDSNLSTGEIVDYFGGIGVYDRFILEDLAVYPIKVLTALKGTDKQNLQENVQSNASMESQEYSVKRFLGAGFDIYPQMYNPNPKTLWEYLENMDKKIKNFSLRVHIGPLKLYGPNGKRLELEAERLGRVKEEFVEEKKREWDDNYNSGCEVINSYLNHTYGVNYKDTVRSDVDLKIIS